MAFDYGVPATHGILDPSSQANVQIDGPHVEVHRGLSFVAYVTDIDLDTGENVNICFTTPNNTVYLHLIPAASNSKASLFQVLEGPTITAGTGTDRAARNRRRTSTFTSSIKSLAATPVTGSYTHNATITGDGTVLFEEAIGGGRANFGVASSSRGTAEWILKPNTTYAFRLVAYADNGQAAIELDWYAHIDKLEIPNG